MTRGKDPTNSRHAPRRLALPRRTFLRGLGVCLAVPLVESTLERMARALPEPKKKYFIGCFFPSGAPMSDAANGDWGYAGSGGGALKPLADLGLSPHVSILRGYRAVANQDVHWAGTAAFLSATPVGASDTSGDPEYRRCARSLDQRIADIFPTSIRTLNCGFNRVAGWDEAHDRVMSIDYVNSISWSTPTQPEANILNPTQLFTRAFGVGKVDNPKLLYELSRKRSMLDGVLAQYNEHKKTLSSADKDRLDAYATSLRDVEKELAKSAEATTCVGPEMTATGEEYVQRFRLMHKIIITAMQCDLTRSATIMYNDGIGPNRPTEVTKSEQHDAAHNDWGNLIHINQVQVRLWGELIEGLKAANLLSSTVTLLGSNMSDGATHNSANVPLLVASQNVDNEMKLGAEIIGTNQVADLASNRTMADLHVDLLKLYGVELGAGQWGAGDYASTGKPTGILT